MQDFNHCGSIFSGPYKVLCNLPVEPRKGKTVLMIIYDRSTVNAEKGKWFHHTTYLFASKETVNREIDNKKRLLHDKICGRPRPTFTVHRRNPNRESAVTHSLLHDHFLKAWFGWFGLYGGGAT